MVYHNTSGLLIRVKRGSERQHFFTKTSKDYIFNTLCRWHAVMSFKSSDITTYSFIFLSYILSTFCIIFKGYCGSIVDYALGLFTMLGSEL